MIVTAWKGLIMKQILIYIAFCVALFGNCSFAAEAVQNADEVQLAKEKIQQLREGYKDYLDAAKNLHEAVEQAKRDIPLLEPTAKAFRDNEEFRHHTLMEERVRYWQYLKNSADPNETKQIFWECRSLFGATEWADALEDPNQEKVLKSPMLCIFRVRMSKPDQQKHFVESFEAFPLTFFDVNEPNDNVLWQNLKNMYLERAKLWEAEQQERIEEMGVPEWLANYAGREDFSQGAFEAYETGLVLLTPENVRQAEIRLIKAGHNLSDIYPGWFSMHHLLDDQKSPENKALVEQSQEHLQIWPVERTIPPSELKRTNRNK